MIDWSQDLLRVAETTVPVILFLWNNKRKAKRDNEKREEENEKRHTENKAKLDYLVLERTFLTPHYHQEVGGPLHAEGIIRKINGGAPRG